MTSVIPTTLETVSVDFRIKDALEFVLANRRHHDTFRDMSKEQIVNDIISCSKEGGTFFAFEPSVGITGIMTAEPNKEFGILFIHNLLCINPRAVLIMCLVYYNYFKGYDIQAIRDGSDKLENAIRYKRASRTVGLLSHLAYNKILQEGRIQI